jgi:hypothetical protein
METSHFARIARSVPRWPLTVALLAWVVVHVLFGYHATWAGEPAVSQCVACHTDAAKLKALTPPDPPPSEEGEG